MKLNLQTNYTRVSGSTGTLVSRLPYTPQITEAEAKRLDNARALLLSSVNALCTWTDNWDSNDSERPKAESINNAQRWLTTLFDLAKKNSMEWIQPYISADEIGIVGCEWWSGSKKLTLDFDALTVEATKITGIRTTPKIINESYGNADRNNSLKMLQLLKWILN